VHPPEDAKHAGAQGGREAAVAGAQRALGRRAAGQRVRTGCLPKAGRTQHCQGAGRTQHCCQGANTALNAAQPRCRTLHSAAPCTLVALTQAVTCGTAQRSRPRPPRCLLWRVPPLDTARAYHTPGGSAALAAPPRIEPHRRHRPPVQGSTPWRAPKRTAAGSSPARRPAGAAAGGAGRLDGRVRAVSRARTSRAMRGGLAERPAARWQRQGIGWAGSRQGGPLSTAHLRQQLLAIRAEAEADILLQGYGRELSA
jgi:hypothetical protein